MQPVVSQVVHYVSHGTPTRADGSQAYASRCRAAIVTEVGGQAVRPPDMTTAGMWTASLCVLNPDGLLFKQGLVQMEDGRDGGTWHWAGSCDVPVMTDAEAAAYAEAFLREHARGTLPPSERPLTTAEMRALLRECMAIVAPGEALVVRVPVTWSAEQLHYYQRALASVAADQGCAFPVLVLIADELGTAPAA